MSARSRMDIRELISDEHSHLSTARVGLWTTMALALVTVAVDVWLTVHASRLTIPNPVYALEGTMFTAFAAWAAGPRIAQYIGPQLGAIAQGIGAANRDKPPYEGMDHHEDGP